MCQITDAIINMKLHNSNIGVFIVIIIIITFGHCADVSISFGCYTSGADTILTANYIGGSPLNRVEWYYSGKNVTNLIVTLITSPCSITNVPAGYPSTSDMVVTCQSNRYQLTIKNSASKYFDSKSWGVLFRLTNGSYTTLVEGTVSACLPKNCESSPVNTGQVVCIVFGSISEFLVIILLIAVMIEIWSTNSDFSVIYKRLAVAVCVCFVIAAITAIVAVCVGEKCGKLTYGAIFALVIGCIDVLVEISTSVMLTIKVGNNSSPPKVILCAIIAWLSLCLAFAIGVVLIVRAYASGNSSGDGSIYGIIIGFICIIAGLLIGVMVIIKGGTKEVAIILKCTWIACLLFGFGIGIALFWTYGPKERNAATVLGYIISALSILLGIVIYILEKCLRKPGVQVAQDSK